MLLIWACEAGRLGAWGSGWPGRGETARSRHPIPPLHTHPTVISLGKGCWRPWGPVESWLDPPSGPRLDLLIKRELIQRYPHDDCAWQLLGASYKDFLSLMDLHWQSAAWGIMLVEAFSGITTYPAHFWMLKVVLGKALAECLVDSCSLDARGGIEDRSFLQGLISLSSSQTGMFGWVSASSLWGLPLNGVKYCTSQAWCWGSQNRRPSSVSARSRHSAHERGALLVLWERQNFSKGFPTCVKEAGAVLSSRIKWDQDCSLALGASQSEGNQCPWPLDHIV